MLVEGVLVDKIPITCKTCELRKRCRALKRALGKGGKCPLVEKQEIPATKSKVVSVEMAHAASALSFWLQDVPT